MCEPVLPVYPNNCSSISLSLSLSRVPLLAYALMLSRFIFHAFRLEMCLKILVFLYR